ncbi:hypothetical protein LV92_03003 [Arenibacter echinorum]|uniref:Glycosyl hydrolase family 67 n=2 Tax=Arenibacter echinorum TaxID=440515 RepID=A0A327R380_9FLAO|nr:hypothetical protein LV92_03003 [Arenibacter echinorum]
MNSWIRNKSNILIPLLLLLVNISFSSCIVERTLQLSIVIDQEMEMPAKHGLRSLISRLEKQKITFEKVDSIDKAIGETCLVLGTNVGKGLASELALGSNRPLLIQPESLSVWRTEYKTKPVWVIQGSDSKGLMYGILDVGERLSWSSDENDPFNEVEPITESPHVGNRAISLYTMNRAYWESRFYNEDYWAKYMDMLAINRFNSIIVIFGYENGGFLAPCYPYFFDVDGFPNIKMGNLTFSEQQKNLAALNRMIEMAHERGLEFKVGIWDHIFRGGIQTGGLSGEVESEDDKNYLVTGLNGRNLANYTKAALDKFLQEVPNIDGIQFRMHAESGLKSGKEMELFWTEVFKMIKAKFPNLQVDLRAKELPESIIQIANSLNLNFRVTTKYWMEQMGLPFHPTHINRENQFDRRHSYADMLRYPKNYKIHWRLWTGGTQRILLWGSPEYARRFAASTHLYDGEGFEINEPLATKMEAQPHNMEPINLLSPPYIYYDYEFERYWHFFQAFGRLAYNPNTPSETWHREFEKRFGKDGGAAVEEALHKASWILPKIIAACSPYGKFPTTRGWPEKQRFGDLPQYALAEGSDIQQFASFDTEAQILIEGYETAKRLPSNTSRWFAQTNLEINQLIAKAEGYIDHGNKEFYSTITDLKILSNLALYHSIRIPAAISYRIYKRTNDPHALDDAINYEKQAIEAWRNIVEAAADVYTSDLMFGIDEAVYLDINHHLSGHWKDELTYLEKGLQQLQIERSTYSKIDSPRSAPKYQVNAKINSKPSFDIRHHAVSHTPLNHDINIAASIKAPSGIKWARLRYRPVNQHLDFKTLNMERRGESGEFLGIVPSSQIDQRFDLMYFFEVMDNEGNGFIYPDLDLETPYITIQFDRR